MQWSVSQLKTACWVMLPIMAAVVLETSIRVSSYVQPGWGDYLLTHAQLLLEMLPFFVGHYVSWRCADWRALLLWPCAFVLYPLVVVSLAEESTAYQSWQLLQSPAMITAACASLLGLAHDFHGRYLSQRTTWLARLLSLDSMVVASALIWTFVMAGVFLYNPNPMVNQPLAFIIDFGLIADSPLLFLHYFWQLLCLALAMLVLYALNRYVLIRCFLSGHGLVPFVAGSLVLILLITPILCSVLLWLPLNNISELTLIPSENHDPFALDNYRMAIIFVLFCSPIILAFERKAQDLRVADIAKQKVRTELQLLQQQVNPHFLFNTLNNLYALCLEKSERAPLMVEHLSSMLRYTVYQGQKEVVTLSQEVQYLQDYLALQQMRYTDECEFTCQWPDQAEQWQLPPLMLICLLENAFKHGVEKVKKPCRFDLTITVSGNRLFYRSGNPIADRASHHHDIEQGGVGLDNLKRRLALQFPQKHRLESRALEQKWVTELELELTPC